MSEKLCVFCVHLDLDASYESGYYEGDCYPYAELKCNKGHWYISSDSDDNRRSSWDAKNCEFKQFSHKNLADAIQTAKTCPDYEQVKP